MLFVEYASSLTRCYGPLPEGILVPKLVVCWHTMKRTTVKLPDDVDARLRHEAERRDTTISCIVREAVEAHLGMQAGRHFMSAGAGHGDETDVARRIEEILGEEWDR
jgi:predicted transcriptional regulator